MSEKDCFVVMPFSRTSWRRGGRYWTNFFKDFITPALKCQGYDARRSSATPENIVKGIVHDLANADLVLAVLTDSNPNVWYELGVRHMCRQGTVMIIREGQKIPFDVGSYGVLRYHERHYAKFEAELKVHITKATSQTNDSPVAEFLH